jgi:hypothetical protein
MLVCVFLLRFAHETAGRIGRPAFPAPSFLERAGNQWQTSGASRRENAESHLDVIASEAKQSIFAAQRKNGLLRRKGSSQ